LRIKEQETRLSLQEHDDDDDDKIVLHVYFVDLIDLEPCSVV